MTVCTVCGNEMQHGTSCTDAPIRAHGTDHDPIRWGDEREEVWWDRTARCGDCGVRRGGVHHHGCDLEQCPACDGQLISCGCLDDEARAGEGERLRP